MNSPPGRVQLLEVVNGTALYPIRQITSNACAIKPFCGKYLATTLAEFWMVGSTHAAEIERGAESHEIGSLPEILHSH